MTDDAARAPAGLRERKKARTRAAIRDQAMRLFREQGYGATTVEQIAAAAEVSPATFFRYFPQKEDVVLQDDLDLVTLEALAAQPPELGPIAAFRAAARVSLAALTEADQDRLGETIAMMTAEQEIRGRALDEYTRTLDQIAIGLAGRAGRAPDDFAIRTITGALLGVVMSVTMPLHASPGAVADVPALFARIDAALALLEAGLPL